MADDHEDGPVRVHLLGRAEEAHAVVGDEVRQVILGGGHRRTHEELPARPLCASHGAGRRGRSGERNRQSLPSRTRRPAGRTGHEAASETHGCRTTLRAAEKAEKG